MKELFSLKGRVALVTGGSRGLGRSIAKAFVDQGARVYITARKAGPCEQTAKELSIDGGECIALPTDLSTIEGIRQLASLIKDREPSLDILVNNAGAAWAASFSDYPETGWDKVLNVNLKTPFFLSQALEELLAARAHRERPSKIINIASIDGQFVNPLETYAYAASKAGLIHLTRRMALHFVKRSVVVSGIAPGPFASAMNIDARDHSEAVAKQVPIGRIGRDADIAGAAVYLASAAGDYVVGATLTVDGGITFARAGIEGDSWSGS